jgi:hypothetical protein
MKTNHFKTVDAIPMIEGKRARTPGITVNAFSTIKNPSRKANQLKNLLFAESNNEGLPVTTGFGRKMPMRSKMG